MKCRNNLKFLVKTIGCPCLILAIVGKFLFFYQPRSIQHRHSNFDSVTEREFREWNVGALGDGMQSTEVSMTQKKKPFIHFRDLLNKTYSTQILTGPDNVQDNKKYFIYRCDTKVCGGWADRVKGMIAAYIIANLTGRTFKVQFILPPCDITKFMVPNHVNWSLPVPFHKVVKRGNDVEIINYYNNYDFFYRVKTINFTTMPQLKAKYIYYKSNLNYMDGFKNNKFHQKQLSWMQNLTKDQITAEVYKRLFKLNPRLKNKVEEFLSKNVRPADKLICAQVRTGKNPTIPQDFKPRINATNFYKIWDFLEKISKGVSSKIFVMTDSEDFITGIKRQSFREKLIFSKGHIVHVEQSYRATVNEKCAGLEKVIFDQFILMHCDTLLISRSGLGIMAANVRGSDQDLFCFLPDARILPCKRTDFFSLFHL